MATRWTHTIARIVTTRPHTTTSARPVRPDSAEEFFASNEAGRPRRGARDGSANRPGRRRTWLIIAVAAGVLVLGGGVAAVAMTMPRITSVAPTALTNERTPELSLTVAHPLRLSAD
ncbi:MAG: hypothetical protein H7287_14600, partial [Thermoleophilia bacterium]|nr:hypothetical protein [Thermoleophilia bacterium]